MIYEFYDMCSGGSRKLKYELIYIEADSQKEAVRVFRDTFKRDPFNITCFCCGHDFEVDSEDEASETIEEATEYHRRRGQSVDEFLVGDNPQALFIKKGESDERMA